MGFYKYIGQFLCHYVCMEQVLTKHGLMLNAICEHQLINTTIIPGFNNPVLPLLPSATNSLASLSASSPELAVAALAPPDTHSNASSHSSGKSLDKPGKSDASLPFEPYSLLMQLSPLKSLVGTVPSLSGRVHTRQVVVERHEGCLGLFFLIMYNTMMLFFCEWTLALTCESECHWKVWNNVKQYLHTSPDTCDTCYIVEHAWYIDPRCCMCESHWCFMLSHLYSAHTCMQYTSCPYTI